jgi:hypothetical protein
MAIKNAYTTSPLENIVRDIQKVLVTHNAQKIMYDYENGVIVGLSFGIKIGEKIAGVKLPARIAECERILRQEGLYNPTKKDHALRVAWANIRDWVDAQMAMIDLDMVKMEEVFLPYVMDGNRTVYEIYQEKFISLPEGK